MANACVAATSACCGSRSKQYNALSSVVRREIERLVATPREGDRQGDALAGFISVTQGARAKACLTDGFDGRAGALLETRRVKEAAQAPEVLLGRGEVAANEVHGHLSMVGEAKARGTPFAPGEVEYPVRQQAGGGVIARRQNVAKNSEDLDNQLG